jgi:hypothetical protein
MQARPAPVQRQPSRRSLDPPTPMARHPCSWKSSPCSRNSPQPPHRRPSSSHPRSTPTTPPIRRMIPTTPTRRRKIPTPRCWHSSTTKRCSTMSQPKQPRSPSRSHSPPVEPLKMSRPQSPSLDRPRSRRRRPPPEPSMPIVGIVMSVGLRPATASRRPEGGGRTRWVVLR